MEANKDAICVVVVPKIGLVYIPGMPSNEAILGGVYEAVLAGINRKCGNSPTLNVNINKSIRSHFTTTE